MTQLLVDFQRKVHDKFLSGKRVSESEYSYNTQSTWHSDFDPEVYIPELPLADLPENPFKGKVNEQGEFRSDTKSVRSFLSRNAPSRQFEEQIFGKQLNHML